MKQENDSIVRAEINVTPLVDVALVLLIIFMVVTPIMVSQNIQLPSAPHGTKVGEEQSRTISLTAAGLLYYEREPISEELLQVKLHELYSRNQQAQIVLRADRRAVYGDVHHILDLAATAGFHNLALLGEPTEHQASQTK